jgi:hypothetical protein
MNWKAKIKLKHLFTESEDPKDVAIAMKAIGEVLMDDKNFKKFEWDKFVDWEEGEYIQYANELIDQLFDYADDYHIWIE